jgi:hypothetical protein
MAQKFMSVGRRHGVTYTPTATLGVLPAVGIYAFMLSIYLSTYFLIALCLYA